MSRLRAPLAPVPVSVGPCQCEGKPHDGLDGRDDGDIVYLRAKLDLDGGLSAYLQLINAAGDTNKAQAGLVLSYMEHGIVDWNFLADDGKPIPIEPDTIRAALPFEDGGYIVAEKAAELYQDTVTSPLRLTPSTSSQSGPTASSTSPNRTSRRHPPKPSA